MSDLDMDDIDSPVSIEIPSNPFDRLTKASCHELLA
jgi:hypothetical protein